MRRASSAILGVAMLLSSGVVQAQENDQARKVGNPDFVGSHRLDAPGGQTIIVRIGTHSVTRVDGNQSWESSQVAYSGDTLFGARAGDTLHALYRVLVTPAVTPGMSGRIGGLMGEGEAKPAAASAVAKIFLATYTLNNGQLRESLRELTSPGTPAVVSEAPGPKLPEDFSKKSYGEIAKSTVQPRIVGLADSLINGDALLGPMGLNPNTLPHEAKAVRKEIGRLRDFVDLFAFAYPKDKKDTWKTIRDDLDEGYELLGSFKDLFDAQGVPAEQAVYDADEVDKLRREALKWKADFLEDLPEYSEFLKHPNKNKITRRDSDDLSPFFWGKAGAHTDPKEELDGLQNIERLLTKLTEKSLDDLGEITGKGKGKALGDIVGGKKEEEDQEVFHDFRKRLRTIVKVTGYFPVKREIGKDDPQELINEVDRFVDLYGDLNDKILKHNRAKGDERDDLEDEINDDWKALKKLQKDDDLDKTLEKLEKVIEKRGL